MANNRIAHINGKMGIRTSSYSGIFMVCAIAAWMLSCNRKERPPTPGNGNPAVIFPRGEKAVNDNFTGTVYVYLMAEGDSINTNSVGNVTFEPGARTKWHLHPAGQILLATEGVGYYQEKGRAKKILRRGDVIICPPNTPHWHGASPDTAFVQLAITGREKGPTVWFERVTEEEYGK